MQILEPLDVPASAGCALMRLRGDYDGPLRRFVASTEETCAVMHHPEITGVRYTEMLEQGMTKVLTAYRPHHPFPLEERNVDVLHFLRGGLNFGLREALHHAYGWNAHRASFLSSQRAHDKWHRWYIRENSYRKVAAGPRSSIFCADVVATGVTLEHGLGTLTEMVRARNGSIRSFHFFTIGCHKAEKVLEQFDAVWRKAFPDFEGIDLLYLEGKFHLADSKTPVQIKLQGTDLLRRDSVLMPAFCAAQDACLSAALERCTIYDAGSRAYDIDAYLHDVVEYWTQTLALAQSGVSAEAYLLERYPEASEALLAQARQTSLAALCQERLQELQSSGDYPLTARCHGEPVEP